MDKMLVTVFDNEIRAYEGSRALQELQREGRLDLYAKAVVAREATGKMTVKRPVDSDAVGMAAGLLTRCLMDLFGGPAELALGAETFGGLTYDLAQLGVGPDFLAEVEHALLPGKAAVVAEVWEAETLPVNARLEALGGAVFRRTRREALGAEIAGEVAARRADLDELGAERDRATGDARASLQKQVDTARARLQAAQDDIRVRMETSQWATDAKLRSLREQADRAHGERRAALEQRIAGLQTDRRRHSRLLEELWRNVQKGQPADPPGLNMPGRPASPCRHV